MSKFKVGDRVTLKSDVNQGVGWTHGNEYVVTRVYQDEHGYNRIKTNTDDHGSTTNGWLAEYFEPIMIGPIRTVTRKEIVPGVYGKVLINSYDKESSTVWINVKEDFGCVEFNSEQLREAAHILNQIAEALEDD